MWVGVKEAMDKQLLEHCTRELIGEVGGETFGVAAPIEIVNFAQADDGELLEQGRKVYSPRNESHPAETLGDFA